jgi:molybdopterin-guanine dinucleotide biosynthesis protein A
MPEHAARALGAIILTGGASARMGADKAAQLWGDRRAIDLVASLAADVGAGPVISAGGGDFGLPRALDPAPHSGPVSGVLAGLAVLGDGARRILVLAVDAPTLRPGDLAPLLAADSPGAAFAGFPLPMVIDRAAVPADARGDWALRRFVERAGLLQIAPDDEAMLRIRGANTPEERTRLLGGASPPPDA